MQTALDLLGADAAHIAVYARTRLRIQSPNVLYRRMPDDALATAQQLFSVLRSFDAQGARLIWVKTLPLDTEWDGVRDRLGRAAIRVLYNPASMNPSVVHAELIATFKRAQADAAHKLGLIKTVAKKGPKAIQAAIDTAASAEKRRDAYAKKLSALGVVLGD